MSTNPLKSKRSEASLPTTPQEWADRGNAYLRGELAGVKGDFIPTPRHDVEWKVRDGKLTIGWRKTALAMLRSAPRPLMERRGEPMSESDTFALNKELEMLGATARYRSDGSKYRVGKTAEESR